MFSRIPKLATAVTFLVFAVGFLLRQMVNVEIRQPQERRAQMSTCQSNLKQIGLAIQMYAQDNTDILPRAATSGGNENWMRAVAPYLHNQKLFVCPTDEGGNTSYVWNDAYSARGDNLTSPSGQRVSRIQNPSQTVLVADGAGNFRLKWELPQGVATRFLNGEFRLGSIVGRHFGEGNPNVLYCDGHIAAYGVQQVFQPRTKTKKPYFAGLSIEDD